MNHQLEICRLWLAPTAILACALVGGYVAKFFIVRRLRQWSQKTATQVDDLALAVVNRHLFLWFVLGGLSAAAQASPLSAANQELIGKAIVAGFFVSLTMGLSRFLGGVVRLSAGKLTGSVTTSNLLENLVRLCVMLMGALLLLSNLGISITPMLTALGVGSLAVALALQDTLGNLFAGIHIIASDMVEAGDYIKLDTGQEGYVVDVGWRATRIRELPNNIVVLPNSKLSQAVVVNYNRPDKEMAVLVQVGVSYNSDLAHVEKTTIEVGREVMKTVAGGVATFDPFIRYHTFGDSSVNFTVILRGKEYVDQYLIKHEFVKRLHARYHKEGIEIPFPQRVVTLKGEVPRPA